MPSLLKRATSSRLSTPLHSWPAGFPGGSEVKVSASNAGDPGSIPGLGRSPGEGNGNPLQYLAWKIPRTEEPGGLQSMGLQKARHNWATSLSLSLANPHFHNFPECLTELKKEVHLLQFYYSKTIQIRTSHRKQCIRTSLRRYQTGSFRQLWGCVTLQAHPGTKIILTRETHLSCIGIS